MLKKILRYLFLIMTIIFGILTIVAFTDSIIFGIIMLVITFIFFFFFSVFNTKSLDISPQNIKIENKDNEKYRTLKFQVAGTFLGGRQSNISKFFFKKIENKEIVTYEGLTNSEIKTNKYTDIEIYEIPQDYEIVSEYPNGLIKFEKEPDNEYDKNAIRILIKGMGTVGYVPKNMNVSFGKILENKGIKRVIANLSGGEYKLWNGKKLENNREDYSITLTINY